MWLACQRASWEPRLPMRMGLRGLLCSGLIVFSRIRQGLKARSPSLVKIFPAGRAHSSGGGRSHAFFNLRLGLPLVGKDLYSSLVRADSRRAVSWGWRSFAVRE